MAEHTPNGLLIKQMHDCLEKQANNSLRPKDLTMMQISVLMLLQESTGMQLPMKDIERHFQVAQSTAAGIISRLEQKGLVEAIADADDRRVKLAHLTPAGEACCAEAAGHMREAEDLLTRGFSQEEKETLHALLVRVAGNLREADSARR